MKLSELNEFNGIDGNLETSIFEYGLLVSNNPDKDGQYKIIYGIGHDGEEYTDFDYAYYSKSEINDLLNESWFDKPRFLSYTGCNKKQWNNLHITNKIYDLILYYGTENILGSSYNSFKKLEGSARYWISSISTTVFAFSRGMNFNIFRGFSFNSISIVLFSRFRKTTGKFICLQ